MSVLKYTTGNGYSWANGREEQHDEYEFCDDDEQSYFPNVTALIRECVSVAQGNDWDFAIDEIVDYDGNETLLRERIQDAIEQAAAKKQYDLTVAGIQELIDGINDWFVNLEQTKLDKIASRELLEIRLKDVHNAYNIWLEETKK